MKRQRSSSGAKTFQRQSWQFQRSWLAQISQPRWEYARSGAAERRRCIGRNDNVIGWIRIFPFWVVDPERLLCRAVQREERQTLLIQNTNSLSQRRTEHFSIPRFGSCGDGPRSNARGQQRSSCLRCHDYALGQSSRATTGHSVASNPRDSSSLRLG